jgi:hypothetical protein
VEATGSPQDESAGWAAWTGGAEKYNNAAINSVMIAKAQAALSKILPMLFARFPTGPTNVNVAIHHERRKPDQPLGKSPSPSKFGIAPDRHVEGSVTHGVNGIHFSH